MSKINSFLAARLKPSADKLSKMSDLAARSSGGNLSSFSGVFKVGALNAEETEALETLLLQYKTEEFEIGSDLAVLSSITSEVKAINNQAVILHGERIQKARDVLKKYKEGAFTKWLIQTYGNRQTPYNFLQYFELHQQLGTDLLSNLDRMPRQAAYTLASRDGPFEVKEKIIKNYDGEPKQIVLESIRKAFPLSSRDKRGSNRSLVLIKSLEKISDFLSRNPVHFDHGQAKRVKELLRTLGQQIIPPGE